MTRQAQARGVPSVRAWTKIELVLAGVLLALAAVAWLLTATTAMPDMRVGILTGARPMAMEMGTMSVGLGFFLLTWVVMMAAMMLPAITPFTVGIYRLMPAGSRARGVLASLTLGYLAVWSALGVGAYLLVRGFDALAGAGSVNAVRAGGVVLVVAGLYQFTPLKQWCLVRCRSPLALVVKHGPRATRGPAGALVTGARHGGYCVGCCWALMTVLVAAGVMSLTWMAVIAAVITVEKVLPHADVVSRLMGAGLVGAGSTLLIAPGLIATAM